MAAAVLLIAALAAYRLTRLVTTDSISEPFRLWATHRFPARTVPLINDAGDPVRGSGTLKPSWPVVLVNCNACVGWWIAGGLALAAHFVARGLTWGWAGLEWPAVAGLGFLLGELDERLTR